jgi:hypothetical protein
MLMELLRLGFTDPLRFDAAVLSGLSAWSMVRAMNTYEVVLEVAIGNAPCGTTSDHIEANTATEAEQKAITAWKALRPDRSFRPLLTVASPTELAS